MTQCVIRLYNPIPKSNRNVTSRHLFFIVRSYQETKKKNLTYVGKLKRNERKIQSEFHSAKPRELG